MKASTRNRIKGTAREAKGRAKQTLGHATLSRRLAHQGQFEAVRGRAQQKLGEIEEELEDTEY